MTESTPERILKERKKHWGGVASNTVVGFLAHNNTYTGEEKRTIFQLAQNIAYGNGQIRVYLEDLQLAIRELRKKGKIK